MRYHISKAVFIVLAVLAALGLNAANQRDVRFNNIESDTARINQLLVSASSQKFNDPGENIAFIGRTFIDTPYASHTLEGEPEKLTVNLDSLDCTTFVESVVAMALCLREGRDSWHDYITKLQNLRYRQGKIDGYPSRLHYISDWAVDNIYRGNLIDATLLLPRYNYATKTIDFMSQNADKYQALADSANLARIKGYEMGYRSHRFPYVKAGDLSSKDVREELKDGDILAFVSNIKNLDFSHMGILVFENGQPYVLHASSSAGKVVISSNPLPEFLKKNRQFIGVRIFRVP